MNDGKKQTGHDLCKGHSARTEHEAFRVCPSKLSKHELENLYYNLLDSNLHLKKTIKSQQDEIKVLSTKLQRATSYKAGLGKDKNCCTANKAIINEQKDVIADLRKSNDKLSERIKQLNMKLCSVRQFLKRNPLACSSRCTRNCNNINTSMKNSSMSALNTKRSESILKTNAASCQYLDKQTTPRKLDETLVSNEESVIKPFQGICDQNKCKSLIEELKEKIATLEKELSKTHEEYSDRIAKIEAEVSSLQRENQKVRLDHESAQQKLLVYRTESDQLIKTLRDVEAQCDNLVVELTMERQKVREMETQAKAAEISSLVAKTLDDHSSHLTENEISPAKSLKQSEKLGRNADDSGYTESSIEEKRCSYNREKESQNDNNIMNQISDLQTQLDTIKSSILQNTDNIKYGNEDTQTNKRVSLNLDQTYYLNEDRTRERQRSKVTANTASCDGSQLGSPNHDNITNHLNNPMTFKTAKRDENEDNGKNDRHNKYQIPGPIPVASRRSSSGKAGNSKTIQNPKTTSKDKESSDYKTKKRKMSFKSLNEVNIDSKSKPIVKSSTEEELFETNLSSKGTSECTNDSLVAVDNRNSEDSKMLKLKDNKQTNNFNIDESLITKGSNYLEGLGKNIIENRVSNKTKTCKDVAIQCIKKSLTAVVFTPCVSLDQNEHLDRKTKDAETQVEDLGVSKFEAFKRNLHSICNKQRNFDTVKKLHLCECFVSVGTSYAGASNDLVRGKTPPPNNVNQHGVVAKKVNQCECFSTINNKKQQVPVTKNGHRCECFLSTFGVSNDLSCEKNLPLKNTKRRLDSAVKKRHRCVCFPSVTGTSTQAGAKTNEAIPVSENLSSQQKTYVVQATTKVTKIMSPDNTEREISSMTDLPTERDSRSPEDYISPGEERQRTRTVTESSTATTTDYGSLSDGELPLAGENIQMSEGELNTKTKQSFKRQSSSEKVEEALKAINEELVRCRNLLQGRYNENSASG